MVVDTKNKPLSEEEEIEQDSGQKGGQSSDFDKKEEEDMGGQDAGNMNNPENDQDLDE